MKKIAIIANLPLWETAPSAQAPQGEWHYCVWLSALCKAMEQVEGLDIHWVIPNKAVRARKTIQSRNQTFHLLPKARLTIGQLTGYAYDSYQVYRTLQHIKPDLVHSWGTEDSFSIAAVHFRGKKLISIQGLLKAYAERARLARFERWQAHYEPYTIRRFDYITTESPWATERVREIAPAATIFHLEYAVEERFFLTERNLAQTPYCLYAGTNAPVKNIPSLIKAFSAPELSHVHLGLAGIVPEEYPALPNNIHILGRLGRDELKTQLSKAWALVHPSLADTGPTIAKEARVMGIPVILTSDSGSKQHVEHGQSGFIITPGDVEAMQQSVLHVTKDSETALTMGAYGRQACRLALSADTMIDRLLHIYRHILD